MDDMRDEAEEIKDSDMGVLIKIDRLDTLKLGVVDDRLKVTRIRLTDTGKRTTAIGIPIYKFTIGFSDSTELPIFSKNTHNPPLITLINFKRIH